MWRVEKEEKDLYWELLGVSTFISIKVTMFYTLIIKWVCPPMVDVFHHYKEQGNIICILHQIEILYCLIAIVRDVK